MRRLALLAFAFSLGIPACKKSAAPQPTPVHEVDDTQRAAMRAPQNRDPVDPRPLQRCFPEDLSGDPARPLDALLDRAADRYDHGDFTGSLACAEEAARVEPRSVEAHHDRAAALQELGKLDEAVSAFTRALAIDPDDPETLAGAADLYVNRLPASNDHTEIGLEYARRGSHRVKRNRLRPVAEAKALTARLS